MQRRKGFGYEIAEAFSYIAHPHARVEPRRLSNSISYGSYAKSPRSRAHAHARKEKPPSRRVGEAIASGFGATGSIWAPWASRIGSGLIPSWRRDETRQRPPETKTGRFWAKTKPGRNGRRGENETAMKSKPGLFRETKTGRNRLRARTRGSEYEKRQASLGLSDPAAEIAPLNLSSINFSRCFSANYIILC